jgi:hypothetical protein
MTQPDGQGGEEIYSATPLVHRDGPDAKIVVFRYRIDAPQQESPAAHYEPNYPADGTELDRIRWLAGIAQIQFNRYIEVVFNPNDLQQTSQPGWYAFRFYQTDRVALPGEPLDAHTFHRAYFLGRTEAEVAAFLDGVARGRLWTERRAGPMEEPLNG